MSFGEDTPTNSTGQKTQGIDSSRAARPHGVRDADRRKRWRPGSRASSAIFLVPEPTPTKMFSIKPSKVHGPSQPRGLSVAGPTSEHEEHGQRGW